MLRLRTLAAIAAYSLVVLPVPSSAAAQSPEVAKHEFDVILAASQYNYERWVANVWGVASVVLVAMGWVVTSKNARVFLHGNVGARAGTLAVTILVAATNALSQMYLAYRSRVLTSALRQSEWVSLTGWSDKVFDQYLITRFNETLTIAVMLLLFGVFAYMIWSLKNWSDPQAPDGASRGDD